MKKMIAGSLTGILTAVFFSGCAGFGTDTNIGNTTNVYNLGGDAGKSVRNDDKPLPEKIVSQKDKKENRKIIILNDQRDLLRVRLETLSRNHSEKLLGESLSNEITGAAGMDEVKIITGKNTDLILRIQPKLNVIDQAGEYFRINAEITVSIKDCSGNRTFSSKHFSIAGTRTLGQEAAIRKLNSAAIPEITGWFQNTVKQINEKELNVAVLKIKLPGKLRDTKRDNNNIHIISNYLGKLGGVVSYGYVGMDTQSGTCEFRIVYFRDKHPGGISNAAGILLNSAVELK